MLSLANVDKTRTDRAVKILDASPPNLSRNYLQLTIRLYIRRTRNHIPQNPCNSTWFPSSCKSQSHQSNMADQAFHLRSISLPFRSFPATIRVEEELHKVRTCAASSTTEGLRGLGEVYDGIDELLRRPGNQQSLSHPNQRKWVEEELDLSLQVLDLSGTIRDALAATTAHLQNIQLSIRRKNCSNAKIKAFHNDSTRLRSTKKRIANSLRSLQKQMESSRKIASCSGVEAMLVEAREILISLFRSASSFLAEAKTKPTGGSWWSAFVTRQLHNKKVVCGEYEVESEGESLAALLCSIQEVEVELESIFRRLIRNRASLLNILSF